MRSLVGFSWYYLIEGPIDSGLYEDGSSKMPLYFWKKYIDIGCAKASCDPFFYYVAGYTLSISGLWIDESYEKRGSLYVRKSLELTDCTLLQQLANNFLLNEFSKKYTRLCNSKEICASFFNGKSLLDKYFVEILNA